MTPLGVRNDAAALAPSLAPGGAGLASVNGSAPASVVTVFVPMLMARMTLLPESATNSVDAGVLMTLKSMATDMVALNEGPNGVAPTPFL